MASKQGVGFGLVAAVAIGAGLIYGSPALVKHISHWESSGKPVLTVYADKLAGGLPTVCDGLTRHVTTAPIRVGDKWTQAKCDAEMSKALAKVQQQLIKCFRLDPPQSVFDAATSHAWNLGVSATCGSGAMQHWNKGSWHIGCQRLAHSADGKPVWSYVKTGRKLPNGQPEYRYVPGLASRRQAEVKMCVRDLA